MIEKTIRKKQYNKIYRCKHKEKRKKQEQERREEAIQFMKNHPDYLNGIIINYEDYCEMEKRKFREIYINWYGSERQKKYRKEYAQRPEIKEKTRIWMEKRNRELATVSFTGYVLPIESVHHHSNNCCVFDFPAIQHKHAIRMDREEHREQCRLLLEKLYGKDFIRGCETGEWMNYVA